MFFFPLRDENPTKGKPYITWLIVALCAMVFMWQLSLAEGGRAAILSYGVTPSALLGGEPLPHGLERIPAVWTIVTSMFMHGGFMHFAGNMLYLWIFGDNVEDAVGTRGRYLALYLVCGTAAALAQSLVDPQSDIPMIGASGAIAGMLGAYLMLYPRANIQCLVGFFIFFRVINVPAFLVLSVWIGLQFLNLGQPDSGVAYVAHIGGFLAGMALIPFFKKPGVSLFAAANSKPFRVVKSADSKSHIPSMVRRKNPDAAQEPSGNRQQKRHPWDD
ncbi:MAG: rhomboid family intramembrane serine protease [Parvibaculales bacterium]